MNDQTDRATALAQYREALAAVRQKGIEAKQARIEGRHSDWARLINEAATTRQWATSIAMVWL